MTGDDAAIQASKDVAFIRPLKPDEVKPLKNPTNEELGDDGINGLSDELFDEQLEREFEEYSNQTLQAIVNKILRGLELNAREENVYKYLESRIELLVLNQGGRGSKAEATKVVESPLQRAKQELDIYKEELLEGVPFKDHAKALKDSKQYQRIINNLQKLQTNF